MSESVQVSQPDNIVSVVLSDNNVEVGLETVNVIIEQGVTNVEVTEENNTVEVDIGGPPGPRGLTGEPGTGTQFESETYTVTPTDISAKGVTLPATPLDPLDVELSIQQGIEQFPQIDFQIINGDFLSWESLAMEALVEVGMVFTVRFPAA